MNPTRRQPHPILFVNGPLLGRRGDAKSRNTRSALIRYAVHTDRRRRRRRRRSPSEINRLLNVRHGTGIGPRGTCRTARDRNQAQESSEAQTTGSRISTRFVPCESHEVPYSM
ncbi:hypothetical protein BA78_8840 [Aspergillus fumigatus]|nr:hypothetical protein BA78_8840 [Aspergillus fumigatus]